MSKQGNDSWLLFEKYKELGTDEIFRTFVAATTHLRFTKYTYYVFSMEEAMRSPYT
jgi:hypothetical protein